uniref:CBF1-interacting co-repressor CIR N-terminal domain-containing protein n=1 Tax=Calcidiscus leptoporus TaxID=127549 RepID=A0A7S0NU80_9EUKA|mmetsp:Transcript_28173/g.65828  ORF Transcript_28173/g.65828 Transcript_28173/m.65828 type:complete len:314 (+) Transcript_28173:126-1067(+)|eukprot:CAMPEP_0119377336 /NCGR_PEP_ID=MMETSP1334-20130426/44301_1 /TAXON_ID=127549 /ORGANISM="Calcidiscus leptoporus, Strain RCC1130" /LENGTH=313 /DNA_ID=CAMNT_0007396207 /DNA_START=99 /DNA_END=1040 /DNA_ORIENTATION=+
MGEKAMSFLNNKSFHPGNIQNRFKLYEAEEKKKVEDRRKEELRREFEQEAQRRQTKSYLTGGDAAANGGLGFMYQRPAGYIDAAEKQQRASTQEKTPAERDVERFGTLLADAPRQGAYTSGLEVTHKPFAVELRKVRCNRCDAWGHQAGDRECPLRNELNPADDARKAQLDPVASLVGSQSSGEPLRWELKGLADTAVRGAGSKGDANQQFVLANDELTSAAQTSTVAMADIDPEVLAALNSKQQKKLLKMYQRELRALNTEGEEEGSKRKRKTEKKAKKRQRKEEKREKAAKSKHKKNAHTDTDEDSDTESR